MASVKIRTTMPRVDEHHHHIIWFEITGHMQRMHYAMNRWGDWALDSIDHWHTHGPHYGWWQAFIRVNGRLIRRKN